MSKVTGALTHTFRMIGFCADCDPMYIIMEHAPGGILLDSLKSRQTNYSKNQLCNMCIDVCRVSKHRILYTCTVLLGQVTCSRYILGQNVHISSIYS